MRKIRYIAVHCTAAHPQQRIVDLLAEFRRKGWRKPGYHYVVEADGHIVQLLAEDQVSNGVKNFNAVTINVAYIGGVDARGQLSDTRTQQQREALRSLLTQIKVRYPKACTQGHRDFSPDRNHDGRITPDEWLKVCPCFDARTEYANL